MGVEGGPKNAQERKMNCILCVTTAKHGVLLLYRQVAVRSRMRRVRLCVAKI